MKARLNRINIALQTPMLALSLFWLVILVLELVHGFTPMLFTLGTVLWGLFLLQFFLNLAAASSLKRFALENWLFALALVIPILRLFHLRDEFHWIGYLTATSGAQLVWVFGSINLGMRSLRQGMQQRDLTFVLFLTLLVVFVGGAGLYHFENPGLKTYTEALYWTAMQLTTIGSGYSPQTSEGQVICLGISIFACAVFGYLTATLASFFIGQSAADPDEGLASQQSVLDLQNEIKALREEIRSFKK
ncbi:MAG: two pore domain potassium channel family protein [Bdellovibrionales bacterium]|nr:two pore domain potassium channel family protein [Bdellovibrionales bacterium]